MQRHSCDVITLLYFELLTSLFNKITLCHYLSKAFCHHKNTLSEALRETLRPLLIPKMPATQGCIVFLCLLLMFSSSWDVAMGGRYIPSSVPSTMRPASADYVKMNPQALLNHKHKVSHEKEVKGCMPKGLRRSSAPSRYVNYQPLGSSCATEAHWADHKPLSYHVLGSDFKRNVYV